MISYLLPAALLLSACVTAGYEGQTGAMISSDQIMAQREANMTVSVFDSRPDGHVSMGEISVRRCHRSFVEDAPSYAAIINDLKVAAFAQGADAISNVQTTQINGLLANCWFVVQGTAQTWRN